MNHVRKWIFNHPDIWEFVLFNIYVLLAVVLIIVSAALTAYSQQLFIQIGIPAGLVPTLANVLNIFVQVVLSYPTMKFWIMSKKKEK